MPPSDAYSTVTVNGSADEFAPSPTYDTPKTPAELEAEKAMVVERENRFMTDTFASWTHLDRHGNASNYMAADRKKSAAASVAAFTGAFDGKKKGGNGGVGGTRRGGK